MLCYYCLPCAIFPVNIIYYNIIVYNYYGLWPRDIIHSWRNERFVKTCAKRLLSARPNRTVTGLFRLVRRSLWNVMRLMRTCKTVSIMTHVGDKIDVKCDREVVISDRYRHFFSFKEVEPKVSMLLPQR